ncbi:CG15253 [Drosophila busckii]|uniref:Metalloendopeptidase n=1 Tax=Drosophila busckii TaxID=30019 RepID=A0A0M4E2H3_DROBS|nr:seminal metalloprotease 1 [Drosophila busckii]ALC39804.1 CG15253 [Drosophila busckii]
MWRAVIYCLALTPLALAMEETDPELAGGYFQGDMLLTVHQRTNSDKPIDLWPHNTVYFRLSDDIEHDQLDYIYKAMTIIEDNSCIHFQEASASQPYYVNISTDQSFCYSSVGFIGDVQQLNLESSPLGTRCFRLGTVLHEMLHTLGFNHEHSAHNRDEFIELINENIQPDATDNFEKAPKGKEHKYSDVYDYNSVMHYRHTAFGKFADAITIVPVQPGADDMGQREKMSAIDILKLNALYGCPLDEISSESKL